MWLYLAPPPTVKGPWGKDFDPNALPVTWCLSFWKIVPWCWTWAVAPGPFFSIPHVVCLVNIIN